MLQSHGSHCIINRGIKEPEHKYQRQGHKARQSGGQPERHWGFMDMSHVARSVKEGAEDNLCGVSKGEKGTDASNDEQDYLARAANRGVLKRREHSLFGHKAQKRWHRSHRGRTNYYGAKCPRHLIPQWS